MKRYSYGNNVELNCTSEGGPRLEYSWMFSNNINIIDNDNILNINSATVSNGGNYTCNVTNIAGSDTSTVIVYGKFSYCY